jgi:hypothetical protein
MLQELVWLTGVRWNATVNRVIEFYDLLTVHLGIIFVNNQLHAQLFFIYAYFYSLHVSDSHVPIIRRINFISTTSGICHSLCIDDRLVCTFG